MTEGRLKLIAEYGPEIIIKCCREWRTHLGNGAWGKCGICRETPVLVEGKKWDE